MAKQINVNLVFNAETGQAKQQMHSLQSSINQLQSSLNQQISMNGLTQELSKAQSAAISLKTNLSSAFNVNTGKLDLTKFNENLKMSKMTLNDYANQLTALGPAGQKAFSQLTQAIVQGEMPLHRTNTLLTRMMDAFGKSIKWSLAYGAINKITQGIRETFEYAQDLNKSLTDIRVITGQSADEMTKFAEKANKAAQVLATSTTGYTKAALIFYRQGLSEQDVEERTKTTLKLSNIVGKSAEEVSQWMTAIWNNFDNGSKTLEYYADVISELGVKTASSAEEIATGLEKFSAIANTVGLSYEYATSALATVTAQTRQSAEVVGTAFKTLFARIEDLNLGKTLEDGTTLGKYSEALNTVGVNIKDSYGNLKDMDNILDEMGSKWKDLDRSQQVALAKNVAGIRQYAQLIALMDNYDAFKQNLQTAKEAEGTLERQQEIWASSWEAASKRVKTAAEGLYDSLIDDKFFINLNNGFADLLKLTNSFINALGGLRSLLPLIAGLVLKSFGPSMLGGITDTIKNFTGPGPQQRAEALALRKQALSAETNMVAKTDSAEADANNMALKSQKTLLEDVENITRHLSKEEVEKLQYILQEVEAYQNLLRLMGERTDAARANEEEKEKTTTKARENFTNAAKKAGVNIEEEELKNYEEQIQEGANLEDTRKAYLNDPNSINDYGKQQLRQALGLKKGQHLNTEENRKILEDKNFLQEAQQEVESAMNEKFEGLDGRTKAVKEAKANAKELVNALGEEAQANIETTMAEDAQTEALGQLKEKTDQASSSFKSMAKMPIGQQIVSIAGSVGMAAAGFSMLSSSVKSFFDLFTGKEELSFEKLLGALTSLGFGLPMVINGLTSINTVLQGTAAAALKATFANDSLNASQKISKLVAAGYNENLALQLTLSKTLFNEEEKKILLNATENEQQATKILLSKGYTAEQAKEIIKNNLVAASQGNVIKKTWLSIKAKIAEMALDWQRLALYAAIAVAIGLVIGITKSLISWYNKDADAAKEATKEAENLAKEYENIKSKYDSLKNSIKDYTETQNALNKLTEGTQEWRDALIEANQQVLEMLNTYPELSKYVESVNGRLTIQTEGWNIIQAQMAQQVADSQIQQQAAVLRRDKAVLQSNTTNLIREFGAIGSYDNVPQEVIRSFFDSLKQDYLENGESALVGLQDQLKNLGVESESAAKEIEKLILKEGQLQKQEELLYQTRIEALLTANSNVSLSNYSKGIQRATVKKEKQLLQNSGLKDEDAKTVRVDWERTVLEGLGVLATAIMVTTAAISTAGLAVPAAVALGAGLGAGYAGATETAFSRSSNRYARDNGFGIQRTDKGEEVFKQYLEAKGLNFENLPKFNFTDSKITYETPDSSEEQSVSYQALLEFEKQKILQDQMDVFTKLIADMTSTATQLKVQGKGIDKVVSTLIKDGDLGLLDPELLETAQNANKKEIEELWDKYGEQIKTFGYEIDGEAVENADQFSKYIKEISKDLDENQLKANRAAEELSKYNSTITAGAEKLEVSEEAIKAYAETLVNANANLEKNTEKTAKAAVEHFTLAKNVNALRKEWEKNINTLLNANSNSLEYAESLGAIKTALDKVFGSDVSFDFIKSNLKDIEKMLEGDIASYEKLQKLAVQDWIKNLKIDKNSKNLITSLFDELAEQANKINNNDLFNFELTADNQKAIDKINELVRQGIISEQQLEAAFANADLEWAKDSMFSTYELPSLTTTTSEVYGGDKGERLYTIKSVNATKTTLPWIGKNPPEFHAITSQEDKASMISKVEANPDAKIIDTSTGEEVKGKNYEVGKVYEIRKEATEKDLILQKKQQVSLNKSIFTYDEKQDKTKAEKEKELRNLDKELDRYHEINELISDQERALSKISKAKDKAYGPDKLKLMDKEIGKQKELIQNNKDLLAEAKKYYEQDRKNLLNNYAVKLDESGRITNYEELQKQYVDRLKAAVKSGDETKQKRIQNEYDLFKEIASQYETTLNKVEEQVEKVNDEMDKLYELNLSKITTTVEIKVSATEDDKAYLDFLMQTIDDDAFKAAEAINILGKEFQGTLDNIQAYEDGIAEIEKKLKSGEITQADAVEQLREYRDAIIDANSELLELRETVQDKLTEAFDAWNDKIEKSAKKFDFYNSVLDNYKNIISIVGKKRLGIDNETINAINDTILQNANNQLAATRAQYEANEAYLADLREKRDAAIDEKSKEEWDKQIELAEEKSQELSLQVQENLTTALEAAGQSFEDLVNQISESFNEAIVGVGNSISELEESWSRSQEVADRYLSTYQQTYEVNKLNRQIEQELKKTDNVKSQKQLRDLQNEIYDRTKDGQKLSKNDLELLQKKYNLMLAEQQLRDAQNAKSVVRLRRDSEGNFGYVYTADQSNIDKAEQSYEDKLYAFQQASEKVNKSMYEGWIKTVKWVDEQIKKAAEIYGEGTKEYYDHVDKIKQQAQEDLEYYRSEYEKLIGYNLDINKQYSAQLVDNYQDTYLGQSGIGGKYRSFEEVFEKTTGEIDSALLALKNKFDEYQTNTNNSLDTAGTDAEDYKKKVNGELKDIRDDSSKTATAISDMATNMKTYMSQATDTVANFQSAYSTQMDSVRKQTQETITKVGALISQLKSALELEEKVNNSGKGNKNGGTDTYSGPTYDLDDDNKDKEKQNDLTSTITSKPVKFDESQTITDKNGKNPTTYVRYGKQWYQLDTNTANVALRRGQVSSSQLTSDNMIKMIAVNHTAEYSGKPYTETAESKGGYVSTEAKKAAVKKAQQKLLEDYQHIEINGKIYIKSNSSEYWYRLDEATTQQDQYAFVYIRKGQQAYKITNNSKSTGIQMDTGGYTGSWGPEGRLAMLHQKELVLNAHDTENFLTAIGIVRDISDQIEKNAMVMQYQNTISRAPAAAVAQQGVFQQEVTIHAEFPNATNHSEIEEAFRNLNNYASQYVNRKF